MPNFDIKKELKKTDVSPEQLAWMLGITFHRLYHWMRIKRTPHLIWEVKIKKIIARRACKKDKN